MVKKIDLSVVGVDIERHIEGTSNWIKDLDKRRRGIPLDHNNLLEDDIDQIIYLMGRLSFEMKWIYSQQQPKDYNG